MLASCPKQITFPGRRKCLKERTLRKGWVHREGEELRRAGISGEGAAVGDLRVNMKFYFYFLTQFQLCSARISGVSAHFTALMFESLCWTCPAAIRILTLKHSAAKNKSYMFACYANYGNYLPSAWMCGCSAPFTQVHIRYDLHGIGRTRYPIMHFNRSNKWKFVLASLDMLITKLLCRNQSQQKC